MSIWESSRTVSIEITLNKEESYSFLLKRRHPNAANDGASVAYLKEVPEIAVIKKSASISDLCRIIISHVECEVDIDTEEFINTVSERIKNMDDIWKIIISENRMEAGEGAESCFMSDILTVIEGRELDAAYDVEDFFRFFPRIMPKITFSPSILNDKVTKEALCSEIPGRGFEYSPRLSKKVSYIIYNPEDIGSDKLKKAKEMHVCEITIDDFMEIWFDLRIDEKAGKKVLKKHYGKTKDLEALMHIISECLRDEYYISVYNGSFKHVYDMKNDTVSFCHDISCIE